MQDCARIVEKLNIDGAQFLVSNFNNFDKKMDWFFLCLMEYDMCTQSITEWAQRTTLVETVA